MGDDDDTRALEFFSRIEDAIITNNLEEDNSNKSSGKIGTILTVTATSNSSISSSSNNNQIEEEEVDSFFLSCDNNNRINNMIVGKEDFDSIGNPSKNYTDKEDGTGDMDVPLTVNDTREKTSINDGNTDQSIETVTVGTYDTAGITANKQCTKDDYDDADGVEDNSDDASSRISESTTSRMKFQPLQPLPGKILESVDNDCSTIENHTNYSPSKISSSISINDNSVKEGGLKFMNNIQDPVAASRGVLENTCGGELEDEDEYLTTITTSSASASASTQQQQVSHTPPTNMSTSYETNHFGKRPRSGSLSERLLVSTELEEKGIINRDQKGILKDLIISGQDNEIQHALDRYEQGDATMLESMLTNGILSTKATEEIDLLGQLDFDFLNVKEQQEQEERNGPSNSNNNNNNTYIGQTTRTGSIASDGIGDLEFDGGVGNWEQGEHSDNNRSRSNSTWSALENRTRANSTLSNLELALQEQQHRSRANSTMSIDLDNFRPRSNSLFSPLIGNQTPEVQANFGRWMETSSASGAAGSLEAQQKPTEQQQKLLQQQLHHEHHFQQLLNEQKKEKKEKQKSKPKSKSKITKPIRRKTAPGGCGGRVSKPPSAATIAKEQLREEKRKVRLLKKLQKEKEKQEKKESKERVKREKQKKKEEMDQHEKEREKEVHMPGSGRPRSMSDPSLNSRVREDGLLEVVRPDGWIGAYSPESRKVRIGRFMEKRNHRVWTKTVKYDVRKNFADSRLRVKGRFVKKDDELLMRELMSLT
mmetsp:Transcript_2835/g.3178  ORF Transcript_2835/g.3178 Transcript_2835/m.3178 type:complete len:765 (-) Transcript_2835:30-2324(-)